MSLEYKNSDYKNIIFKISNELSVLGVGDLAELRRMDVKDPGCSAFWKIAVNSGFSEDVKRTDQWMMIVKIMAILMPKGGQGKFRIHDTKRPFGAVLCDGGDISWHGSSPLLSETRLMRLLAERNNRGASIERIARMITAKNKSKSGINCNTIAELILFPNSEFTKREIARAYYQRLNHMPNEANQKDDQP